MQPDRNSRWYRTFYTVVNGVCRALDKVSDGAASAIEGVEYAWTNASSGVKDAVVTKVTEVPAPRVARLQDMSRGYTIVVNREGVARIVPT